MKKIILIIIFLLVSTVGHTQWFGSNPKSLLKLPNTWTEEQTFGHIFIDSSLSLYNLNGNRWFYANGEDSSLTINGTINATNVLDPADFSGGKLIIESNGFFVPRSLDSILSYTPITKLYVDTLILRKYVLDTGTSVVRTILPQTTQLYNLGGSSAYWLNTYTQNLYLDTVKKSIIADSLLTTASYKQKSVVTIADSVINCNLSNTFSKTLGANQRFVLSNIGDGQTINIAVTNTASNYTVTWVDPSGLTYKWKDNLVPTQTIGANTDMYRFIRLGTSIYAEQIKTITGYFYVVGNETTDGSWRYSATLGGDLIYEYRLSGVWTEKSRITK